MSAVVRNISTLPFTAVRMAFRAARRLQRGPAPEYFLPVAGITQERAHIVMFSLREAASALQEDEDQCAGEWLAAVAAAQAALDRLQIMLADVESHLLFWRARLESPRHGLFLLIGQGPVKFGRDLIALLPYQRHLAARRHRRRLTSTERIEQQVTILRALQQRLAAALGTVNTGAGGLHMRRIREPLQSEEGAPAAASDGPVPADGAEPSAVLSAARLAIMASLAATTQAYEGLQPLEVQLKDRPETLMLLPADTTKPLINRGEGNGHDGSPEASPYPSPEVGLTADADSHNGVHGSTRRTVESHAVAAALRKAHAVVGAHFKLTPGMTFTDAMRCANIAAYRKEAVLDLPSGLRPPSKVQQHWLKYALAGCAASYGALFLYRHSRLSGSHDLEDWAGSAAMGLQSTYRENVMAPLAQLRDELFKTFRSRRSIVSELEYENDKESLQRMLLDFRTDYVAKHGGAPPSEATPATTAANGSRTGDAVEGQAVAAADAESGAGTHDMAFMMKAYEAELKRPIRSAITGQLPRTLLIQVQKLKLDTESAMLQMDQLLKANQLNLALIAAIPAFLVAGGGVWLLVRWLRPAPIDRKYEALACRMAMVGLERSLQAADGSATAANLGLVTHAIARVYAEAHILYDRRSSGHIGNSATSSEWPLLRQDLTELAGPAPLHHKLRLSKRMSRVYSIFQF